MTKALEIRVHGVSNTPPESMLLEHGIARPGARLCAGDEETGFYRREGAGDDDELVTEAYSWGALTSGDQAKKDLQRAGWALLLPFAFANVALWARPGIGSAGRTGGISAYLARVLAVSLTVGLVLAAAGVGMDQVGWQCRDGCRTIPGTGFLSGGGFWDAGLRPVAVGMLAPLLLLGVIVVLARRSFAYEAQTATVTGAASSVPFAHPCFWYGDGQVRRLALVHTAAAIAAIAGVGTLAGLLTQRDAPAGDWLISGLAAAGLSGLALVVVLALLAGRGVQVRARETRAGKVAWASLWLSAVALLCAAVFLLGPARPGLAVAGGLPGFGDVLQWLFIGQFALVLLIGSLAGHRWRPVVTALLAAGGVVPAVLRSTDDWPKGRLFLVAAGLATVASVVALAGWAPKEWRTSGDNQRTRMYSEPVWGGRSAAMLAGAGWAFGSLYSAAVLFWVADWLNGDATVTSTASTVQLPVSLLWSAAGLVTFVLPLLVAGAVAAASLGRLRRTARAEQEEALRDTNPSPHEQRRSLDVADAVAVHRFIGQKALGMAGFLGGITVVFAILGVAGTTTGLAPKDLAARLRADGVLDGTAAESVLKWLTDSGAVLAGLTLLGLAALVGLTYRKPRLRRSLGIVWDLATFWPRGAHPFAPPSYGERAVPHLLTRIGGTRDRTIVLAGHSQGAVLAVATVLQLPAVHRDRVHLLTFGTQLTRLYGRIFPAFFDRAAREHVARVLTGDSGDVRWRSLHRATDPLGWEIGTPAGVDVPVPDPDGLAPVRGEVLDPPIRRHSDYPCSPEYLRQRSEAIARTLEDQSRARIRRDAAAGRSDCSAGHSMAVGSGGDRPAVPHPDPGRQE
jgi:hypothetical protein